ncbi:MAG: serine/threonine protein kinase [Myxococcota bacterium]
MAPPCSVCGSTQDDHVCPGDTAALVGKSLDGRYDITGVLGQGGMGMVFAAIQTSVQREVAVKTLHASLAMAPQFFERFKREAEVASRLRHPNVITIFDFGRTSEGTCYYVMELLEGESLKQIVKREGPMSLRRAVGVIEQAARGLAHAHNMGCVHRDLKPHNIMIQNLDGQEFVKVLDFGLVKALEPGEEEQLTSTGQVLGTPQYMPPEQAGGEGVDQRSDLYSLAGVLYFCLTGTSPFGANTVRKALQAALTQQVPPIATHRKGAPVPPALDALIQKALSPEKEDRQQSAEELIAQMKAAIAGLSDTELDALPSASDSPREGGSASHSGKDGATLKPRESSGKPSSKVVVSPELQASGRGKRTLLLAGLGALFLAGGGFALVQLRAPAVPPPTTPLPPRSTPTSAKPEQVTVKLVSVPAGAEVLEEGVLIGKTPLVRKWTRDQIHSVVFQLAGYQEARRSFKLSEDETVEVALDPIVAKTAPPKVPKKPKGPHIPVFE